MNKIDRLIEIRKNVDLLIFDVDGVLVDTSMSYTKAIRKAVYHYGNLFGLRHWEMPSVKDVSAFRMLPGFNNDWDLSEALLVYKILEYLRVYDKLNDFLEKVRDKGSGLESIYRILENLNAEVKNKANMLLNKKVIRRLTMEYYGGIDYCRRLYGFDNQYVFDKGMLESERLIVGKELLKRIELKKAIVTGRNEKELEIFFERTGIKDVFDMVFYHGMKGIRKPDKMILESVKRELNTNGMVYFGDSYDDYLTVKNYKESSRDDNVEFVQILNNDTLPFSEYVIAARDINEVLKIFERK